MEIKLKKWFVNGDKTRYKVVLPANNFVEFPEGVKEVHFSAGIQVVKDDSVPVTANYMLTLFGENRVTAPLSRGTLRVLKVLSRALSDMTDALVYFLRKTLFRPARIADTDPVRSSVSYRIGAIADRISGDSTKKSGKRRKKPVPSDRHAKFFYQLVETVIHTTHNLSDSMSFALLMLALAITAILFYVLFVHRFG